VINVQSKMADKKEYSFNVLFFRRFWQLHKIFFPGLLTVNSGLLGLLLLTSGLEQYLAYNVGIISGQFFKVLGEKDLEGFKTVCIRNILILVAISVTKSARVLSTKVLVVGWRQTLCQLLHKLYMSGTNYYRLNVLDATVDNPDQRMTSDVSSLIESYSNIISHLVVTPFTIGYYTYDAYTRAGWIGPTGMYAIFIVSTLVNKLLMRPVVKITVEREKREGDFRFKHIQVRSNAESLAFHGSAEVELHKLNSKLSQLCGVQQRLYYRNFVIDISINLFAYLGGIASYLVIAGPIFAGQYDNLSGSELSQKISENAFVCIYLVSQLSTLVGLTGTVASIAGSTHRVCELIEELILYEQRNLIDPKFESSTGDFREAKVDADFIRDKNVLIECCNLDLFPPNNQISVPKSLIRNLDLKIVKGSNLLLMGPSSSGKTSFLRTLRGLWKPAAGTLHLNRYLSHQYFFLPQKPFFTSGSLREQINYPLIVVPELVTPIEEQRICHLFELTNLTGLVERCAGLDVEPTWNWYDVLSPGEQQRLAFVRLLFHKPVLAVLDEGTSAVSEDVEEKLYSECIKEGICLLSVGHRKSLKQFHHQVLHLTGVEGGWYLEQLATNVQPSGSTN